MTRTMAEKIEQGRHNAQAALDAYYACGGMDDDETVAIRDLIEDLLHLAEDKGILPSEMQAWAEYAIGDYFYEADPENADEAV